MKLSSPISVPKTLDIETLYSTLLPGDLLRGEVRGGKDVIETFVWFHHDGYMGIIADGVRVNPFGDSPVALQAFLQTFLKGTGGNQFLWYLGKREIFERSEKYWLLYSQ